MKTENTVADATIEKLAALLMERIGSAVIPAQRRLWSITDIAAYCGKSQSTVQQRIVCLRDFPDRIKEFQGAQPRWVAGEVMDWFESKRSL